jgi:hypothetical protein
MTFHVICAEKGARPLAAAAQEQAQFDVIHYRETQGLVAAAFPIGRGAHEVESANANIGVRTVSIHAGKPAREAGEKQEIPRSRGGAPQQRARSHRYMIGSIAFGHSHGTGDHIRR